MSDYKEFYRDEYPFKDDLGKDPLPEDKNGPIPPEVDGFPGVVYLPLVGGYGLGVSGGGGGFGGGGDGGSGPGDNNRPLKPNKIVWRVLATLTASIVLYDILKDPVTGKIMIDKINNKIT
jgi:hypothetical protein